MRIDHYAYQRGTRVAGFGLLLQLILGLVLLLFGLIGGDTAFTFASIYVLAGAVVWLSLIIIFHQHKLERLEALEEDEMAGGGAGATSIFEARPDEQRVAARRLAMMHKWLMPSVSLGLAVFLGLMAWWQLSYLYRVGDVAGGSPTEFLRTGEFGWGLAVCLGFALIAFIFSRFVAGMAKQQAWQNLRGGAGYVVGVSLLMLVLAAALAFRIFNNHEVIWWAAHVVPIFMAVVAGEIVLNFILNLYRPRIPGEVPRPAFDSRLLSILAAPDSIVRSINEAVNYQFGFDITSSWGYQLLLRSFVWLIAIGVVTTILLNMMVVVEPHQQAIRLRFGERVGEVHDAGIMWKWPWPFETAQIEAVGTVREVNLTGRRLRRDAPNLWTDDLARLTDERLEPFIVGSTGRIDAFQSSFEFARAASDPLQILEPAEDGVLDQIAETDATGSDPLRIEPLPDDAAETIDEATAAVSRAFALIDAEMSLHYRIKRVTEDGRSGLLDFLNFVPDVPGRRNHTLRDRAIRSIALREVTRHFSTLTLEEALSQTKRPLAEDLKVAIQQALDRARAGIEVVSVNIPLIRPHSQDVATVFEDVNLSIHARREEVALKQGQISESLTQLVGDPATAMRVLEELDELDRIEREAGPQSPEAVEQRLHVERLLRRSGGIAARTIAQAETDRWVDLMNKKVQATRTQSQILAFRASPTLYKERELMRVLSRHLGPMRKYVIGIDPSRINISSDMKELSPLVDMSLSTPDEDSNQ